MNAITPGSMLGGWMCIARRDPTAGEKTTGARRRRSKGFAEPLAVSFTSPPDFPISALADLLVRPFGAASTYFRCALGASGNLGCPHRARKGGGTRKNRIL